MHCLEDDTTYYPSEELGGARGEFALQMCEFPWLVAMKSPCYECATEKWLAIPNTHKLSNPIGVPPGSAGEAVKL